MKKWLTKHPDARIVADLKDHNIKGLTLLKKELGPLWEQLIPQIYNSSEYSEVQQLGEKKIIFTLYKNREKLPNSLIYRWQVVYTFYKQIVKVYIYSFIPDLYEITTFGKYNEDDSTRKPVVAWHRKLLVPSNIFCRQF